MGRAGVLAAFGEDRRTVLGWLGLAGLSTREGGLLFLPPGILGGGGGAFSAARLPPRCFSPRGEF